MTAFITQILQKLLSDKIPISDYTFILPSKRAGAFLISELAALTEKAVFSPRIFSIEEFVQEMSGLKAIDNTTTLFEFYSVYLRQTPKDKLENFESFSSWSQTLIHDFNEIDRYLVDHKSFFGYLSSIQEMNHWYLQEEKTPLMENYLSFWRKLPEYYEQLKLALGHRNIAYQGMVYRKASECVGEYLQKNEGPHVFIGFNALNNAEQVIVQEMVKSGRAEIFWDIDEVFFNDPQHDASLFMRHYFKSWPLYRESPFEQVSNEFSKRKDIDVVGVPKNVGQAKYIGELLSNLSQQELKNTAVVLGDEDLLLPVLNSLPANVGEINVTMGFPLKSSPVASLFEHLLKMNSVPRNSLYYKDVISIVNHPLIQKATSGLSKQISKKIQAGNLVSISLEDLLEMIPSRFEKLFLMCFGDWKNDPKIALSSLQHIIYIVKSELGKEKDKLTLEFIYQFNLLFNKLRNLLETYPHLTSVKSLFSIYKDLLSVQTVDFRGKPFSGLQIMGMLETRVLDFENVILTSVNEGVLPAGKGSNSFIPFDLKCAYKLPTYKEKDAVYTYHFYHLINRASKVCLLYNTESNGLNAGEKSRFLLQLEIEKQEAHRIGKFNISPKVPAISPSLQLVEKGPGIMDKIKERAMQGFSPSALTTYIRNPIDFYRQYILGIKEPEEVEETIAYNTLGTVVHQSLETFYKEWIGREILVTDLKKMIPKVAQEVSVQFQKEYTKEPLTQGKNLLIFEVAKRYVVNFLKAEIKELEAGNSIKIMQVETKLRSEISLDNLAFPVYVHGMVDRVDEFNGITRIIDYKTGKVQQNQLEIENWDDVISDYDKYGKTFQVLAYASMMNDENPISGPTEAGIISFKNLQKAFLKFTKKSKNPKGTTIKESVIDQEVLEAFQEQLKNLITEICNPEIPFLEKEIKNKSW